MRLRAFPFPESVSEFIANHDHVFVVEQNRDAQMRTLLINELEIDPLQGAALITAVLHYDGTPITARFITEAITKHGTRWGRPPPRAVAGEGQVMTYIAKPGCTTPR
jgi:2-oxoglutarate ferredoxin oxidoreductase subunit alpha